MNQNEKKMGLKSMEERVKLLEGQMQIESRPAKGTRISIVVPFRAKSTAGKGKSNDHGQTI